MDVWEALKTLLFGDRGAQAYRAALAEAQPPLLP